MPFKTELGLVMQIVGIIVMSVVCEQEQQL